MAANELGVHLRPLLTKLVIPSSDERKAVETTDALLSGSEDVVVRAPADPDLREIGKPWIPDPGEHHQTSLRYLRGELLPGWEPQERAATRFARGIARLGPTAAVVTHGTVTTLYVVSLLADVDPASFWLGLTMPDAWLLDLDELALTRVV